MDLTGTCRKETNWLSIPQEKNPSFSFMISLMITWHIAKRKFKFFKPQSRLSFHWWELSLVLPKDMINSMQTKFKLLKCNKFIHGITTAIQLSISQKYKKLNLLFQLMHYQALLYGDHGIIGNLVLKWFSVQKVTCIGLRFKFLQDTINTNSIVLRRIPG